MDPCGRRTLLESTRSPRRGSIRGRSSPTDAGRGAIIELDSSEEDEVRILANNMPVARGMVIVSGNRIAVEVKELLPRSPEVV